MAVTDSIDTIYNIRVKQNVTFSRVFTWTDANGNLLNLTGYTAVMKVRKNHPATLTTAAWSEAAVITFSTANGKIVLGGVLGTATVTGTAADMTVPVGLYDYDLLLTSGSNTYILSEGSFEVRVASSI